MKFKSLLLRQRAASGDRLRRVFFVSRWTAPGLPGGGGLREREAALDRDFPPGAAFSHPLFKGVAQGHLGADVIHQGHHVDGLPVGHGGALQAALPDAVRRLPHLVLVARQLGRAQGLRHQAVLPVVHPDGLGVVDVLHHQVAVAAVDGPVAVGHGVDGGGQYRHAAVGPGEGDAVRQVHPLLRLDAGGLDAVGPAEGHLREVQGVDPHVQQGPAGQLRPDDPLLAGDGVAQVGGEEPGPPDGAGGQNICQKAAHGLVPGPDGLGDEQAPLPGEAGHLLGLGGVDGEGLLAEHMLAVGKAEHGVVVVVGVGGGDVHQVHGGVRQHLLIGAVGPLRPVPGGEVPGPREVPGGHGVEAQVPAAALVHAADGLGHDGGDAPRAQKADVKHSRSSWRRPSGGRLVFSPPQYSAGGGACQTGTGPSPLKTGKNQEAAATAPWLS